jgi:ABC-2 type transport system ATP-binding protein
MDSCIQTHGLTKRFDDFVAVDAVDLEVERGAFYGFLGPNGAGKSTTIKMLTGLVSPTQGEVLILGHNLATEPLAIKGRTGVVTDDLCLFENLTAREYLTFTGRMYSMDRATIRSRQEELLELLGLADTNKTLVLEFSHGMKKKLALASALIHAPDLLFLDEPFEGVDAIASRTIRAVLDQLRDSGATIFLTSHVLEIVEKLCTHVGIIQHGKLVAASTLDELSGGSSLEQAFVDAVGAEAETQAELSWLGT